MDTDVKDYRFIESYTIDAFMQCLCLSEKPEVIQKDGTYYLKYRDNDKDCFGLVSEEFPIEDITEPLISKIQFFENGKEDIVEWMYHSIKEDRIKQKEVYITVANYRTICKYLELEEIPDFFTKKTFAFHRNDDCKTLHSIFKRPFIPNKIKEQGEEIIQEFKEWCNSTSFWMRDNNDTWEKEFKRRWEVEYIEYERIPNSGCHIIKREIVKKFNFKPCKECYTYSEKGSHIVQSYF